MWAEMSSNFGMVSPFFAKHAFAANRLWCIPDSWYMTAYTAAAVPFPLESQNVCSSKAWLFSWAIVRLRRKLSSPGHFPLNFPYFAFCSLGKTASQGRCRLQASLKTIFPTKVNGLPTPGGLYVEAKLLSTSISVAFCQSPEGVTARVFSTSSKESPCSFSAVVPPPTVPWHMFGYLLSTDYLLLVCFIRVRLIWLKTCPFENLYCSSF